MLRTPAAFLSLALGIVGLASAVWLNQTLLVENAELRRQVHALTQLHGMAVKAESLAVEKWLASARTATARLDTAAGVIDPDVFRLDDAGDGD